MENFSDVRSPKSMAFAWKWVIHLGHFGPGTSKVVNEIEIECGRQSAFIVERNEAEVKLEGAVRRSMSDRFI